MEIIRCYKTAKAVLKAIYEAGEAAIPNGKLTIIAEQLVPIEQDGYYEYTLRFRVEEMN